MTEIDGHPPTAPMEHDRDYLGEIRADAEAHQLHEATADQAMQLIAERSLTWLLHNRLPRLLKAQEFLLSMGFAHAMANTVAALDDQGFDLLNVATEPQLRMIAGYLLPDHVAIACAVAEYANATARLHEPRPDARQFVRLAK